MALRNPELHARNDDDDAALNKYSSYHPVIPAFWFLPLSTGLIQFTPQVWLKQVFARRNPTLPVL